MMNTFLLRSTVLAGLAAFVAASMSGQTILFQETFENATVGSPPATPPFSTTSFGTSYTAGSAAVQADPTGDVFGTGPNQYLRVQDGRHFTYASDLSAANTQIVTLSFDFIPRANTSTPRWVNVSFYGGGVVGNNNRLHVTGLQSSNQSIRANLATFGTMNEAVRFDIVFNNSVDAISISDHTIPSGEASVWINGTTHLVTYNAVRILADSIGVPITGFGFVHDSNEAWTSYDIDNITVFDGAVIGAAIPEPSTYALLFGLGVLAGTLIHRRRRSGGQGQ